MQYEIKKFEELSNTDLYDIAKIRAEVFVIEQSCFYSDLDGKDKDSFHLTVRGDEGIVAYLRILEKSNKEISFGRVLVAESFRKQGYAKKIVDGAIEFIAKTWEERSIVIEAQTYLQKFYESFGFKAFSEEFLEDGIPHIWMRKV